MFENYLRFSVAKSISTSGSIFNTKSMCFQRSVPAGMNDQGLSVEGGQRFRLVKMLKIWRVLQKLDPFSCW